MSYSRSRLGALAALAVGLLAADPPLELETLAGEPVVLAAPRQGVLLAHFWATWCHSCVEELPVLEAAARDCGDLRVIAVNVAEPAAQVRDYLAEQGLELEVLRDPRGEAWRRLSGAGLPANATWSDGERRVEVGPRSAAQWQAELARLGCET